MTKKYLVSAMDNCNGGGFRKEVETYAAALCTAMTLKEEKDWDGSPTWVGICIWNDKGRIIPIVNIYKEKSNVI